MALPAGKSGYEAQMQSLRATFVQSLINADNAMLNSMGQPPLSGQNLTMVQNRYNALFDALMALFSANYDAFVQAIQTYAQVSTTVNVVSVTGVMPGGGISGPGTGTGIGTIA